MKAATGGDVSVIDFPIVDSHIHLLDQQRFAYSWAKDAPALKREWTVDDLANRAKPYELEGLVFVEVDVDMPQYLDEAEWVDGLAAHDRRVLGAVVCLPLERGPSIEPEIARVAKLKTVRGVRRLIQNQPDPEFMLKPGFLDAVRLLSKYNLSFDTCILHPQMPNTLAMMRQCPEVSFILDHIGKPGIKAGLIDPWRAQIREMAALPNVVCKLSGVTTEADLKTWTRDQLRPYIDHVIECFGPDRILYGGDWPVSELAGSYLQWLSTLDWATAGFSPADKRKLFRDNAIKAYRLGA
jgi:L-fuconolactonase